MGLFNGILDWTNAIFKPMGSFGLFLLAFLESSFFPVPPDVLLIAMSVAEPDKALWFALICTIGSVLGGMFGYFIGYVGEMAILEKLFAHNKIQKVHNLFQRYEAWAILIAAFTPIPYKVFTIAGGVFYIKFWNFVLMSLISRGLRFFIVAIFVMYFGQKVVDYLNGKFEIFTLVVTIIILISWWIYKKHKKKYCNRCRD